MTNIFNNALSKVKIAVGLAVLAGLGYVGYQYAKPTTPSSSQEKTEKFSLENFLRSTEIQEIPQEKITYVRPTINDENIYKRNLDEILEKISVVRKKIKMEGERIKQQQPEYTRQGHIRPPQELLEDLKKAEKENWELDNQFWATIHSLYGYLKEQNPNLYKEKEDQEYERYLNAIR